MIDQRQNLIPRLKLKPAGRKVVMEDEDGRINQPFSYFLNLSANANTQASLSISLEILHVFLIAFDIKLPDRAINGRCLESVEINDLVDICYRPLEEIVGISPRQLRKLINPAAKSLPKDRKCAVFPATAAQRLHGIASFLSDYKLQIAPYIFSRDARERLESSFEATCQRLRREVGGSVTNPHDIRSVPGKTYQEMMKAIYRRPKEVFHGENGQSRCPERDRAMALLACEGLRSGEIGNIRVNDLYTKGGETYLTIVSNTKHRPVISPDTPRPKGADSTKKTFDTERKITLWPWTVEAILAYQDGERKIALSAGLRDTSKGFLFLTSSGKPVESRRTISLRFEVLETGLRKLGLLSTKDDNRVRESLYDLSAHVLRHSAASFFLETKLNEGMKSDEVMDQMRERFGWTAKSDMPNHYANRSISDRANVILKDFWRELKDEACEGKPR